MKEILEYIKLLDANNEALEKNQTIRLAQNLYLYLKGRFFPLRELHRTVEGRIAKDVVKLERSISVKNEINSTALSSSLKTDPLIIDYQGKLVLNSEQKTLIRRNVIEQNQDIVKAIFITDLALRNQRRDKQRFWLTIALSILTVSLTAYNVIVTLQLKKLQLIIDLLEK